MILSRKYGVRVADYYFNEALRSAKADIVRYNNWPEPVSASRFQECWTILIDLGRDSGILWREVDKNSRNEIRRAEREGVGWRRRDRPDEPAVNAFADFFDCFAAQKNLPRVSRKRLLILAAHDSLEFSTVESNGEEIVWHAWLRAADRMRLLHSASLYRSAHDHEHRAFIGRANRCLHWQDLLSFQRSGCRTLDMGGWDPAGAADLQPINSFKKKFGGSVVREFNCERPLSVMGRVVQLARNLRS